MAQLAQYKVNQFAKDLNLKSKDVIDILESKKMAVKSQSTLDEAQFDVLFEALTSSNQITGIEDYIDGITYIPSAIKADEQAKKAEPAAVVAPAQKTEKNCLLGFFSDCHGCLPPPLQMLASIYYTTLFAICQSSPETIGAFFDNSL